MTALRPDRVHVHHGGDDGARRRWFREALAALVPVSRGEAIGIKPNLGSPLPESTGATTALWMIEETALHVRARGGEPWLLEAPSHIHDYDQVMRLTGALALCERIGLPHGDARVDTIATDPTGDDGARRRRYRVSRRALAMDGIVCLPKLKTHNRTGVTVVLKGLMGLLAVPDRHGFHRRGVHEDVVELYRRLAPKIRASFVDGVVAMEGHGPTNGSAVRMDVLVAGTDAVAVDAVSARIMGFDPRAVRHLARAATEGLGSLDVPWEVHPSSGPLPSRHFARPRPDSGLRTAVITFPPLSATLRFARMGVRGRSKPFHLPVARCASCGVCADVCPTSAIDRPMRLHYEACVGCGLCIEACPEKALVPETRAQKYARVAREIASAARGAIGV
ncbi:MAG: DUF362 domain-containing protein [Minicystis sp.]